MRFKLTTCHYSKRRRKIAACLVALWLSVDAIAQNITVNELKDIDFGAVTPTVGRLQQTMSFCVSLDERLRYNVTAWGLELGSAFELTSGPYKLPFLIEFSDRRQPRRFETLSPGSTLSNRRPRGNVRGICRRNNAHLRVTLDAAELAAAPAGQYRSTITLMVSPE